MNNTGDDDLQGAAVVLDTNVLDQTGLLRDPLSVAMLFYLRHLEGQLVLPEVVATEWSEHSRTHFEGKVASFLEHRQWLDRHIEGVPVIDVDVVKEAEKSFTRRLDELGDLLEEVPIEKDDWHAAGRMVLEKRPPSKQGSQQFKDSLLWRALLRIGQQRTVFFVSTDKGFRGPGDDGLEETLSHEASREGAEIRLVTNRKDLLDLLKDQSEDFAESMEGMWEEVETAFIDEVNGVLQEEGWEAGGWPGDRTTEVFATGMPDQLVVALTYEGQLSERDDPESDMPMFVQAEGSALVDIDTWNIETLGTSRLT